MSDKEVIDHLSEICSFGYILEDEVCKEISFYDENSVFGGTIRKHPLKRLIVDMVSKLEHLRTVNFRKCKIGHLLEMNTQFLEYLDLSCNDIECFPEWLLKQPLKSLNLGANKLRSVPDLSCLTSLETLKLHKNMLSEIPCIGEAIKNLNLFLNPLKVIPHNLPLLEVFTFGVTEVSHLPPLEFPKLRWLTLAVNQIKNLPDEICLLQHLEGLQLAKNKLTNLPNNIGDLKNLSQLGLYSNELSTVPESFFSLKLRKLNLAKNPLKERDRLQRAFDGIEYANI